VKITTNRILRFVLNVVQYYNVRLKVIANVAAATTILLSEERIMLDTGKWEEI
jgi:hypothetical protein